MLKPSVLIVDDQLVARVFKLVAARNVELAEDFGYVIGCRRFQGKGRRIDEHVRRLDKLGLLHQCTDLVVDNQMIHRDFDPVVEQPGQKETMFLAGINAADVDRIHVEMRKHLLPDGDQ